MPSETGNKIAAVIILTGIGFTIAGICTDAKGFYALLGVILLFMGRVAKEYF